MGETLVPLVCLGAGYFFLRLGNLPRYRWDALQWERNVLEAGLVGGFLFVLCSVSATVFDANFDLLPPFSDLRNVIRQSLPYPHVGSLGATVTLSLVLPLLWNRVYKREWGVRRAVDRHCGQMLSLLQRAGLKGMPVMLTMQNRKVYVGLVQEPPAPRYAYTRLLPTISGYRNSEKMTVQFTTRYAQVYTALTEEEVKKVQEEHPTWPKAEIQGEAEKRAEPRIEEFCIVLPIADISSAHLFDDDTYSKHFEM